MIKKKQAALTTTQIVILIVLITSFVIILFFIFRLNLQGTTDEQICHNSIVQRGSSILSLSGVVPLNCKRKYICISTSSRCTNKNMPDPDEVISVENEKEVYEALAEEMANCWWMYGEGEIDYLGETDLISRAYCSICSSVVFDKSISEEIFTNGYFEEREMNNYLVNTKMPGEKNQTYAEYFYKVNEIPKNSDISVKDRPSEVSILPGAQYYIITAMNSKPSTIGWIAAGIVAAGIVAASLVTFGGAAILTAAIVGVVIGTGGTVGGLIITVAGKEVMTPTLINVNDFEKLECEDIKSLS